MAFEEVSRVEVTEIMRRWQAAVSIRHLAGAIGAIPLRSTSRLIRAAA